MQKMGNEDHTEDGWSLDGITEWCNDNIQGLSRELQTETNGVVMSTVKSTTTANELTELNKNKTMTVYRYRPTRIGREITL